MKVIWSKEAADDLTEIVERINLQSIDAGRRLAKHIFDTIMRLPALPYRGRKREEDSSLEIVFVPWPYVAVYEVVGDRLYIKAIRHAARDNAH